MKGVVIKSTGNLCQVLSGDNVFSCKIKGKTRLLNIEFTNPISVGDHVDFNYDEKNQVGLIDCIHKRKNYIIRKSVNLSHKSQVIASNIDLALLIVTIDQPTTSLTFIDRFLIQSEAYKIPAVLIFNKIDLYTKEQQKMLKKYRDIYENIGYKTITSSIHQPKAIQKIQKLLDNKVSVLAGHSGVGKSSLINLIDKDLNLQTKDISSYHNQGVHTTTYTEMFSIKTGGYIIDTPGIKGLGLVDLDMHHLPGYFREMIKYSVDCKFNNCMHINEPNCGVLSAVSNGLIASSRYKSYLSMLEENTNYRRNNY